jgi:hypothetical protein
MGDKYADADDGDRQIEMWKIKRVRAALVCFVQSVCVDQLGRTIAWMAM